MKLEALLLASLYSFASIIAGETAQNRQVAMTYRVDATRTLHEPVIVTFSAENLSSEPATIDLGADRKENFRVVLKNGPAKVREVPPAQGERLASLGEVSLTPGERYAQRLLLDEWLIFDQPGTFEVDVELAASAHTSTDVAVSPPSSTTLRFRILPRNENALRAACARLVAVLSTESDVNALHAAARELSSVRDPLALQYLSEALHKTDSVDFILLPAVTRLNTSDAKQLLEQLSQGADSERAARARNALKRMQ